MHQQQLIPNLHHSNLLSHGADPGVHYVTLPAELLLVLANNSNNERATTKQSLDTAYKSLETVEKTLMAHQKEMQQFLAVLMQFGGRSVPATPTAAIPLLMETTKKRKSLSPTTISSSKRSRMMDQKFKDMSENFLKCFSLGMDSDLFFYFLIPMYLSRHPEEWVLVIYEQPLIHFLKKIKGVTRSNRNMVVDFLSFLSQDSDTQQLRDKIYPEDYERANFRSPKSYQIFRKKSSGLSKIATQRMYFFHPQTLLRLIQNYPKCQSFGQGFEYRDILPSQWKRGSEACKLMNDSTIIPWNLFWSTFGSSLNTGAESDFQPGYGVSFGWRWRKPQEQQSALLQLAEIAEGQTI